MIPIERVKEVLTKESYKDFCDFMEGQTVPVNKKNKVAIYEDDFLRWILGMEIID